MNPPTQFPPPPAIECAARKVRGSRRPYIAANHGEKKERERSAEKLDEEIPSLKKSQQHRTRDEATKRAERGCSAAQQDSQNQTGQSLGGHMHLRRRGGARRRGGR